MLSLEARCRKLPRIDMSRFAPVLRNTKCPPTFFRTGKTLGRKHLRRETRSFSPEGLTGVMYLCIIQKEEGRETA